MYEVVRELPAGGVGELRHTWDISAFALGMPNEALFIDAFYGL
ncbi:hypothetical protein ACN28S_26475 [Cystobacter fuscus]